MGDDDKEKTPALSPRVLRALDAARKSTAAARRPRQDGRWLALIPASFAVIVLAFMMPRAAEPDAIPLPTYDERVLERIAKDDDARAAKANSERLSGDLLTLGTAIRKVHATEAELLEAREEVRKQAGKKQPVTPQVDERDAVEARRELDAAIGQLRGAEADDELISLRAVQTRLFLDGLSSWEATGKISADLRDLGGVIFLSRSEDGGWMKSGRLLMSESQRRVAFKIVWNTLTRGDGRSALALSLDEQRAIYSFYIEHPHPPDSHREALAADRRAAKTADACARAAFEERREAELWRADKIKRLATIDPQYPALYALGVAYYRAGRYDLSVEAFNAFVGKEVDGAYSLRAKNHLKAALLASGSL